MKINLDMYSHNSRYILGFHGCDESVAKLLINKKKPTFKQSQNKYDWLGNGMYFWENDPTRAWEYVNEAKERAPEKFPKPTVVGAVLDLGHCLNLTDNHYKKLLKDAHKKFKEFVKLTNAEMPKNKSAYENDHDKLLRPLDRAVIEFLHATNTKEQDFDSVRGMFVEGSALYKGAGFHDKTHVQIAIRNPSMIKAYFKPIFEHKEI